MQYYLLQQILEMMHMYSTPLSSLTFSTNSIQQTQQHTQLHAKGDPRNNVDTPQQLKLAHFSRRIKPHGQTLQSNGSQHTASSRMKPQSWTLPWEHQNAIPSQLKKLNIAETQVSMILTQNETTKPKTAEELTFACNASKMKPHRWTSSQAHTRISHIWYQMCWHCSYSNITCLPLFTVQSTLQQNCHMSILYTS